MTILQNKKNEEGQYVVHVGLKKDEPDFRDMVDFHFAVRAPSKSRIKELHSDNACLFFMYLTDRDYMIFKLRFGVEQ